MPLSESMSELPVASASRSAIHWKVVHSKNSPRLVATRVAMLEAQLSNKNGDPAGFKCRVQIMFILETEHVYKGHLSFDAFNSDCASSAQLKSTSDDMRIFINPQVRAKS